MGKDQGRRREATRADAKGAGYRQLSFGAAKRSGGTASLADLTGIATIIDRIACAGDGIIFSKTSDGGAYAITLLTDDRREKAYAASQADLEEIAEQLANDYPEVPAE
jgi:hypothetical protein